MIIIAASLETYNDELIKIVKEPWKFDYVIVGGYAREIIRQQNILKNFQFVYVEEFEDKYIDTRISLENNVEIPIRSYNAIFIKKGKIIAQVFLDPDTIPNIIDKQFITNSFINSSDPYDLENDLLDNRAAYKEIVLKDNKLKSAREFAKFTKSPLICVVNNTYIIKEQLINEYDNLPEKWKQMTNHPDVKHYTHYTVKDKIYHNIILTKYYGTEIIFVEEKDIEIL